MKRIHFALLLALTFLCLVSCELLVPQPEKGKVRIVTYGNDYKKTTRFNGGTVRSLNGTVNDAVQAGNLLSALAEKAGQEWECTYLIGEKMTYKGSYPIIGVPASGENVTVLDDLSLSSLRGVLAEYASDESVSDNDVFIFFYSGHGLYDKNRYVKLDYSETVSEHGYFCLSTNKESLSNIELYQFSDFLDDISAIKGKKVVIADCCYSGCLADNDGFSINKEFYPDSEPTGTVSTAFRSNIAILTASQYFNESQDWGSHGEFMNRLIEATGWNEEEQKIGEIPVLEHDRVTLDAIASYVRYLSNESYYGDSQQKVTVTGGSQDFILFQF